MKKKIVVFSFCLAAFLAFLILPDISNAQSIIDSSSDKYEYGKYGLNDMLSLATWAANWILGIVGSLTLLMFIYGGFIFLTSAGSNEKVGEAKKIITAAVIGLVIVFGSAMIIKFVTSSLGISWSGKELEISSSKTTSSGLSKPTEATCTNYKSATGGGKTLGEMGFSCVDDPNSAGYCMDGLCPGSKKCCAPNCSSAGTGYSCTTDVKNKTCLDNLCKGTDKCCK